MNSDYRFVQPGLRGELNALSPDQAVSHLRNHLGNFLLDPYLVSFYINRFTAIPSEALTPHVSSWLVYLVRKYVDMHPLDEQGQNLLSQMGGGFPDVVRCLQRCKLPEAIVQKISGFVRMGKLQKRREALLDLLGQYRFAIPLIENLMDCELKLGIPVGEEWEDRVVLPPLLRPLFRQWLCEKSIIQNNLERAWMLYDTMPPPRQTAYWLNHVAVLHERSGQLAKAAAFYARSLHLDPLQKPLQYHLEDMGSAQRQAETVPDASVAILLYSHNKAELLAQTLESLAASETGTSRIAVLLNGCTDDSAARVDVLNDTLFSGRIRVFSLPTNIGAPAARNWLLTTDEACNADYVAFLDDDVSVSPHWLTSLLAVLRSQPQAGVAGCKILNPSLGPQRLQYLYRNVSVALPGLLRLSFSTPLDTFDPGYYDHTRETCSVMGCCHVFSKRALEAVPFFDIRFSPSQMDDVAHDLELALAGFKVIYHGKVSCIHHQMSGIGAGTSAEQSKIGNVMGNDVKFYYKFLDRLDRLALLNNNDLIPDIPPLCVLAGGSPDSSS